MRHQNWLEYSLYGPDVQIKGVENLPYKLPTLRLAVDHEYMLLARSEAPE